jgi:hypothetical protein
MSHKKFAQDYADELSKRVLGLIQIYEAVPKNMPMHSALEVELDDGRFISISKKQIRTMRQELIHEIEKGIPKKFNEFMKESRKIYPSDFKGVYKPVVIYSGMRSFFEQVNLGTIEVGNPSAERVIEYLPCIQKGYGLRNSFHLLWYLALHATQCQDEKKKSMFHPTQEIQDLMKTLPCGYVNTTDDEGKIKTIPNTDKISMMEALTHRFNVIDKKSFDPNIFEMHVFTILMSLNTYKDKDLTLDIQESLQDKVLREQMLKEYNIIDKLMKQWKEYNKQNKEQKQTENTQE